MDIVIFNSPRGRYCPLYISDYNALLLLLIYAQMQQYVTILVLCSQKKKGDKSVKLKDGCIHIEGQIQIILIF